MQVFAKNKNQSISKVIGDQSFEINHHFLFLHCFEIKGTALNTFGNQHMNEIVSNGRSY